MKKEKDLLKRNLLLTIAALLLSLFAFAPKADAASWICSGSSDARWWNDPSCWDAGVPPGDGDDVSIRNYNINWDLVVRYLSISDPLLGDLTLDGKSGKTVTLELGWGANFSADNETIGYEGTGEIYQSGDTNTVSNYLVLGELSGSSGTYNLSGGVIDAYREYIGGSGTGEFNQSGGTNTITNDLYLGWNTSSSGTYNLSGGNLLADTEYIGFANDTGVFKQTGVFNQTGGTNSTNSLILGDSTYTLSGGTLAVGGIGNASGIGTLNIDGGTLTMPMAIDVDSFNVGNASGSNGSFTLATGPSSLRTLTAGQERIGNYGTGEFNQGGGTNNVSGWLYLGYESSGSGTYNMSGISLTQLSASFESIGRKGSGEFNQSAGTNTITSDLYLGMFTGSSGTYNLSSIGQLSASNEYIGFSGTGEFNQNGGTNTVSSNLYIGYNSGSFSMYNLNGGALNVTGNIINGGGTGFLNINGGTLTMVGGGAIDVDYLNIAFTVGSFGSHTLATGDSLTAGSEYIGYNGQGSFSQTGGTNTVLYNLTLGNNSDSSGTYELSGGELLANYENIGAGGTGNFMQTGGTNSVATTLTITTLGVSSGTYDLSNGTLTVQNAGGTGEIINNDTFNYSGGTLNADIITNNGDFNLSGTGTRTVNGDFTNTGTVKVTDTTVVFTGTYTELGTFSTDPSDVYFTDLIVGDTGYLVGGVGDRFFISGDFTNNSTQGALWDTSNAYLGFTGTGLHNWTNLTSYAWGTLELWDDVDLTLSGSDLYVSNLTLSADTTLDLGGFNLFYSGLFTGDLGSITGGTFTYTGGSAPVPEPSTMLLLASGLAGLAIWRRKQNHSGE